MKNRLCRLLFGIFAACVIILSAMCRQENSDVLAVEEYKVYAEEGDIRDYITGHGSYFDVKHSFYRDSNGNVVYCLQSGMRGADITGTTEYQAGNAAILSSSALFDRISEIVARGYPSQFGTYIVGGTKMTPEYRTGLLIDGTIYKCTAEEARAATAFAIHRQMFEYQRVNPEAAIGNDRIILDYNNGAKSVNDTSGIQELLIKQGNDNEASIVINWVEIAADGNMVVTDAPCPVEDDFDNMYLYAQIISDGCVVSGMSLIQGDVYVQGAVIDDINYISEFERIVKIKIPNTVNNSKRLVGIACNAATGGASEVTVFESQNYQDILVVPDSNGIYVERDGYMPGGSGGLVKLDCDTKEPISGVGFGVFSDPECKNQAAVIETDMDGRASVGGLECGIYYVKELYTRDGYIMDSEIYELDVQPNAMTELIIYNKRMPVQIIVEKRDSENDSTLLHGDAVLEGAVYGLYAREDIVRIDGNGGVLYSSDELVQRIVIDENCRGCASDLYPGRYYLKEITPPKGYMLDTAEYDVDCRAKETDVSLISRSVIVSDAPVKQAFQLLKFHGNEGSEQKPLAGAGFTAWLVSDLSVDENGKYDVSGCEPYPIGMDGSVEMFTDKDGYACSSELPYGTYLIRETTVPEGFLPLDDFFVTVAEDSRTPQKLRMFNDEKAKARLKIIKTDGKTGNTIMEAGYEFKIFDISNNCYVKQRVTYPENMEIESYFTNDAGFLIMPEPLEAGKYRIEETGVPDGSCYALNSEYIEIEISSKDAVYMDDEDGAVIEIRFPNKPIYGKLIVHKVFEGKPDNLDNDKVIFGLYSEEHRIGEIKIDSDGYGYADCLPVGRYYLIEEETLDGYIKETEKIPFEIKPENNYNAEIVIELEMENRLTEARFDKQDCESGRNIEGAVMSLTDSSGRIIDRWESGISSHIVKGLIIGEEYILVEEYAPYGYLKAEDITFTYDISDEENTSTVIMKDRTPRGRICINKTGELITQVVWQNGVDGEEEGADILYSEKPLESVEFKLYAAEDIVRPDGSGDVIYEAGCELGTAVTDELGVAVFDDLMLGKYIIVETKTSSEHIIRPYSIPVSLDYVDQYTELVEASRSLHNDRIRSHLTVNKYDKATGEPLSGAKFGLYSEEDIYNGDGNILFPKDYLLASCLSNTDGTAEFNNSLIPGRYYIMEVQAPDGYEASEERYLVEIKAGESKEQKIDIGNFRRGIVLGESGELTQKEAPQNVRTGDDFQPLVVVMLIIVIIAILSLSVCYYLKAR